MKSTQKLTLLFWHRKSKADTNGFAPVICRITIDRDTEELSIGRKVHVNKWNTEFKQAFGGPEEKKTNLKISQVTVELENHFAVLQNMYEYISPLMLKNVYQGLPIDNKKKEIPKPVPKQPVLIPSLLQTADLLIADFAKKVEKNLRSPETLKQWRATRNKIEEFIIHRYQCRDIELAEIQYSFALNFYDYLTLERKEVLQEAAAKKQIKNTKQVVTYAMDRDWIAKNPIARFKCGGDETDVPPLEYLEVEQLWRKDFHIDRLSEVRDVFIFQCFTGFAFQDVYALTTDNIILVGLSGERWLIKDRGKTGVSEMVPIMPIVEELIQKYQFHTCRTGDGLLLPVNSNGRYNGYLKEIAVIGGINRDLNTHLARHTFADIMLNICGFSLEEVSKMLGHKTIRTTQRYAKVRKTKISQTWSRVKNVMFADDGQLRQIAS